jgi:Zn-dependent protease with chaperone function
MTELVERRLSGISPKAYEHPADRAATAALKSIPGLDAVVRKLIELRYERAFRQALLASSVKLGPDQLPEVWSGYERALACLDLPDTYDVYLTNHPFANAAAIGSGKPMILMHSSALTLLDEAETQTILGHELGHIHSDHVLYQTALIIILQLVPLGRLPDLAGLPLLAIRSALLEWFRAAELSSDRAATLVNRDPLVTCRTLMVLAGGLPSGQLNLDAFLRQAQDYEEWKSAWDRFSRLFSELNLTHSYPVRRVGELMAWVRAGDYDRIVAGEYPKRGEADAPVEHAEAAYRHYRDRFKKAFEDAGETIGSAAEKMATWVSGKR